MIIQLPSDPSWSTERSMINYSPPLDHAWNDTIHIQSQMSTKDKTIHRDMVEIRFETK